MHDRIGPALRAARLDRGMSLRTLATSAGVSASQLSQIETGKSQPSVSTLYALVNILEASLDDLMGLGYERSEETAGPRVDADAAQAGDDSPAGVVQRGVDNPVLEMANGVRWEKLAVSADGGADALLVTYEPGAASSIDRMPMRHQGTEYAYLFAGELTLLLDFDRYTVRAGDSLCFDSTRPHMYVNQSDRDARGVWFVSGRRDGPVPDRAWVAAQLGETEDSARPVQVSNAVDALDILGSLMASKSTGTADG